MYSNLLLDDSFSRSPLIATEVTIALSLSPGRWIALVAMPLLAGSGGCGLDIRSGNLHTSAYCQVVGLSVLSY